MCLHVGMSLFVVGESRFQSEPTLCFPRKKYWCCKAWMSKASTAGKLRTKFLVTYLFKQKSNKILLFRKYQWGFLD